MAFYFFESWKKRTVTSDDDDDSERSEKKKVVKFLSSFFFSNELDSISINASSWQLTLAEGVKHLVEEKKKLYIKRILL
jgi:hypothetical protein